MKNFIYELCAGNFRIDYITDKDYLEARSKKLDTLSEIDNQLQETLSDEQKKLLQELIENDADIWTDEIELNFARGVKLGMLLQSALDKITL